MKRLFFILCAYLCVLTLSSSVVYAQEKTGVSGVKVQPATLERGVEPGEEFTFTVHVTNLSSTKETYYFDKKNISGVSDEGTPAFAESGEETGYEMSSWVNLPLESIDVNAGETKDITLTVKVPQDASPGGHFGGVFVSQKPPKLRQIGSGVGFEVGSIISLKVAGEVVENSRIREFFSDKTVYSKPDVLFTASVENTGNSLVRPRGTIEIQNLSGKKVAVIKVNDANGGVLPKANRLFTATWKGDSLSFGRYQAIIALNYGDKGNKKSIEGATSFWVLPLSLILPFLGVILFFILAIYFGTKYHLRKKLREMSIDEKAIKRAGPASPISKLTVIAVSVLSFTVLFLLILFAFFA